MRESWRIGVDVGGTFTDIVAVGTRSGIRVHKTASTPSDPSRGVITGVAGLASAEGLTVEQLLANCSHFIHGTTIATNTLLEGKGARTGMVTTAGFRDIIEIRRGFRDNVWDYRSPWADVLVPRSLRRPVGERVLKDGSVELRPETTDLDDAITRFKEGGIEAVAVCCMNSYLNPGNEQFCVHYLKQALPGIFICGSADLAPLMGEYERFSTCVVNAYVGPKVVPYLRRLDEELRRKGLANPIMLIQSNGGACEVDHVEQRPVTLLLSGPAAGVGAVEHFSRTTGLERLVTMEIGGTSCDVMLYANRRVAETTRLDIGGYPTIIASVEINTVSTGGGTIARVDRGGMLHVGPEGAGSVPGPACYGLGGVWPTVTDAHVVLGRLRSGPYADGSVNITHDLAHGAIDTHVAEPLELTVEQAAIGIIRLAEQNMLHAIERVTSERGVNPASLALVACGGAGALHGAAVARLLGCREVLVPRLAGVFCAFGMCNSNVRRDHIQSFREVLDDGVLDAISQIMVEKARDVLASDLKAFDSENTEVRGHLELKYRGQQWAVRVDYLDGDTTASVRRRFEREFEGIYGYQQPDGIVEIVAFQIVGKGLFPPLQAREHEPSDIAASPIATRRAWVDQETGFQQIPVFADLQPGMTILGPAIVEETTTTILVGATDLLRVDQAGDYRIVIGFEEGGAQ